MKRYLAEFLGTFFLVFFGCGAVVTNDISGGALTHVGVAICWGLVVMILIYGFGWISGTHINSAVTISLALAKKMPRQDIMPYLASQILGAIVGAYVLMILFPGHSTYGSTLPVGSELQSLILEFFLTFFLMLTIYLMTNKSDKEQQWTGFIIGMVVLLEAMFAGPISGASMNPARSLGPAIVSGNLHSLWVYVVGPIGGSLFALLVYRIFRK